MSPADILIREWVDAQRDIERWTARAALHKCPNEWQHLKNKLTLTSVGADCDECRAKSHAQYRLNIAIANEEHARARIHKHVLIQEDHARHVNPVRRKLT